ncbi:serine/threonine-protein phosphatase 7 long form homolog [Gossypium arboreum]|uniref:serine/threonine-protein phosphatase 7 long form homolog n=1 Tax=Gossypium arboreum TaxID=29729 RepID=UPI0022F1755E|nr:serine/threonine-protein phosphatase 7 long form homolog [Gossypium arboreum]
MTGPPSLLIKDYLREAGFWHVAMIGRGCKLDLKLISALIERWRPETHTFHLPCGECTITLEDVHLQLELPMDGDAITGSIHSANWGAVCYELFDAIPDNINGGRIEMGWLRDTFSEPDDDSTELEKIRYARAYILQIIGGYLMPDLSQNLVNLRWLLKLVDFRAAGEFSWGSVVLATLYREMCWATRPNKAKIGDCLSLLKSWARWNHSASYARLPTCLEDIRLLLDQRSEAQSHWSTSLLEMHQLDRVLRQFGFRQPIPVAPEVLDDHHKIELRQLHTDWPRFWSHYIQMWEDRYDYIPTREPIITPELACVPEYVSWFKIHGKPYLLSEEERQRQLRVQRERRGPLNPRRRDDDAGPSTAPHNHPPKEQDLHIHRPNSSTVDTHKDNLLR